MRLEWRIDQDARAICWKDLMEAPVEMLKEARFSTLLDLGSSNGAFGRLISKNRPTRVIGVDLDRSETYVDNVESVQADILHLPFKDESFDAVSARAVLHHVPHQVEAAVEEASRVLREGKFFICQEPTSDNLISELARRILRTVLHDPSERAFSADRLERAISARLVPKETKFHLVFTYLLPHLLSRFRGVPRRMLLGLSSLLALVDQRLLTGSSFWRDRAAYVTFLAEKPSSKR